MAGRRSPRLRVVETSEGDPTGEAKPIVKLVAGRRRETICLVEEHLIESDVELFQRGDSIVRLAPQEVEIADGGKAAALGIIPVKKQYMSDCISSTVDLRRFDKRTKDWVTTDCPVSLAESYLEGIGTWRLRVLHGITTSPLLRPDGSILDRPGYDPATGVYFDPQNIVFPAVAPAPSREDALAALERFDELLSTFDFVDDVARSVALSAILSPIYRRAIGAAPLHGITSPLAGSGKSKLVNIAAIIATGYPAPAIALGKDEAETEKRLTGVLIAGDRVVAIDNAERPIGGEFICQVVTEPLVLPRLLGTLAMLRIPNTCCLYATGNNLKFAGDMVRRALLCRLDPGVERPELRDFETPDPCLTAFQQRPELVCAALTMARAFAQAGKPRQEAPLGSFEGWSTYVRDLLIWLGRADPVEAMNEARREDPRLSAMSAVLEQWTAVIGSGVRVTARDLVDRTERMALSGGYAHAEFREALLLIAHEAGRVSGRRLGNWCGQVKGRWIAGKRLIEAGKRSGSQLWMIELQP